MEDYDVCRLIGLLGIIPYYVTRKSRAGKIVTFVIESGTLIYSVIQLAKELR